MNISQVLNRAFMLSYMSTESQNASENSKLILGPEKGYYFLYNSIITYNAQLSLPSESSAVQS